VGVFRALGCRRSLAVLAAAAWPACFDENLVIALSSGDADDRGSEEGVDAEDDSGNLPEDRLDLGSGGLDPDLLDPQVPRDCSTAFKFPSNMGCTFLAVDLDQAGLNDGDPSGIVAVNVQSDETATVEVSARIGGQWQSVTGPLPIAAGLARVIELPDSHHAGSGLWNAAAYRIEADLPVGIVQLSPLAGGQSWRSGATLLHPHSAWTAQTHVVGWRTEYEIGQPAYVAVASLAGDTLVEAVPSMRTDQGPGVPAGQAGVPIEFVLGAGSLLQLAARPDEIEPDLGLTGTVISARDHEVAVFSAHACAGIPDVVANECGHLQEQLTMHLQGREFMVARLPVRDALAPEPALYQLYAVENDTQVELLAGPGAIGVPEEGLTLNAGERYSMWISGEDAQSGNFVVRADSPLVVAAYLGNPPPSLDGSPSMVQLAPVDRHLREYTIWTPPGWDRQVAAIARPGDAEVTLDGVSLDDAQFVPLDDHEVAHVDLSPGLHHLRGSEPFSLVVVGTRPTDGYAYLGGWATPMPAFPPPP
jgi:hypothetical protein